MIGLRDYQEKIVEKMVEALNNGHSVIINAPTGTGKTIMALETLRRLEKTGYVYVRTISQYSSWERDAVKLGMSFGGLMRKGEYCKVLKKPYYLWCTKCAEEVDESDVAHLKLHKQFIERKYINPRCYDPFQPKPLAFCRYRLHYVALTIEDDKELAELTGTVTEKVNELLKEKGIKGTANWFRDNKIKVDGKEYEVCARDLTEGNVDIKIYSYIYFFLGLRRPDPKDDVVLIFDEAHNLDDFNTNSVTLTAKEIERYFSRVVIGDISPEKTAKEAVEQFKEFVKDPDTGFYYTDFLDEELQAKFSAIVRAWNNREEYYIERDLSEFSYVKAMPADPALWLSRLNDYRYILLSGTMPSRDYIKTVWGLNNFEYINALSLWSSTSLSKHFSGARIYLEDSVEYTKAERPNYRKKVAEIIRQYASKDGLNLVILPSYEELEAYRSIFFGAFFEDIRPDVLERVKKLPDGSIVFAVAGGKLSEGIEVLDGEGRSRIKAVFVVGLPIPEYKDPYLDKMIEVVAKRVNRDPKAFKWVVLYEKAVIKVKQAIGRAIRGPQDSANIYLIDKRFGYVNVRKLMGLEVV
ncbi:helicase C-terminal domain-containing protein [Sulfurisphaera ohwakuensis]|uniref:helicase C-terminal domain-containing protein n=1 Tax=Sulfurisphaera ohwakuensis TaxID=69656 RepID=UPI0036F3536A